MVERRLNRSREVVEQGVLVRRSKEVEEQGVLISKRTFGFALRMSRARMVAT